MGYDNCFLNFLFESKDRLDAIFVVLCYLILMLLDAVGALQPVAVCLFFLNLCHWSIFLHLEQLSRLYGNLQFLKYLHG